MQTYRFNTANQGVITQAGRFVRYVSGTAGGADNGILLSPERGGSTVELEPGASVRFTESVQAFRIAPRAGNATVTGALIIGDGEANASSVAGTVEIVDGGKARTEMSPSTAGLMECQLGAGPAGTFNRVSLWNPAGSGQNAFVKSIYFSSANAQPINIESVNAAYSTLNAVGVSVYSKKLGEVYTGVMRRSFETTIAASGGSPKQLCSIYIQSNQTFALKVEEPLMIRPGFGLSIINTTPASDLSAVIEFFTQQQ